MSKSNKRGNKIVFLGRDSVGKTSIFNRFSIDKFSSGSESTIGAAYKHQTMKNTDNGKEIPVDLWDTAGQERFLSLGPMYYRGADIILLVFDLTDFETLERLTYYMNKFMTEKSGVDLEDVVCIVVGTKKDLISDIQLEKKERVIKDRFEKYNLRLGTKIEYEFVSSKTKENINNLINKIVDLSGEYDEKDFINENITLADNSYIGYLNGSGCSC
jgi:small GTP-binding protein